jgi:dynein light intermediate chain 1
VTPPPADGAALFYTTPAPARNPFPFAAPANVLDRDRIVVPAGWDSWGKIGILRDGFDPKAWGAAWERDLAAAEAGEAPDEPGALDLFAALVEDESPAVRAPRAHRPSPQPPELPPFNEPVSEQTFLARHYDENAKKPDRDPRGAFRTPGEAAAGLVGPLGSSSFSLPTVERALLEMDAGPAPAGAGAGAALDRKRTGTAGARIPQMPAAPVSRPSSASPATPGAATSPGGQTQHEVLHNFFQSLLTSKDRAGQAATASKVTTSATKPAAAPEDEQDG